MTMNESGSRDPSQTNSALQREVADMERLCEEAQHYFRQKNVGGALKTSWNCSFHRKLVSENSKLSLAHTLMNRRLEVLVHVDQRKGSATTNLNDTAAVKFAIDSAVDLAKFSVADPCLAMATVDEAPVVPDLEFAYSASTVALGLDELAEFMADLNREFAVEKRLRIDRAEIAVDVTHFGMRTSTGVLQQGRRSELNWFYLGMAVDGEAVSGLDYDVFASFSPDIQARLRQGAREFRERMLQNLKPIKCPSYKGLVVLSPRAVDDILGTMIRHHSSGRQVVDGKSQWADELGKQVASPLLSLVDDPHRSDLVSAAAFDRDGLPTRKLPIIENGRLSNFSFDCYSARRASRSSNGQAGGPFGPCYSPGSTELQEMLQGRAEILLVDRFSGDVDPIRGPEISGVAKGSSLWVNGERQGNVVETMISGDFFEMARQIVAVSRQTENVGARTLCPYMLIDGVSVASR